jgi:DNA repair photolyase
MSPVLTNPVPGFSVRRRHAPPTPARLFPDSPDVNSPKTMAAELAPLFHGPGGQRSEAFSADCPPPGSGAAGTQPANVAAGMSPGAKAPLVGIARLAAASPPADTRRKAEGRPEYFVLPVKSILNRCDSQRVPFEWTINPYRGCEFGCKYCYARYTHEYMELDGGDFERKIFVKKDAGALLAHDVSHKYSFDAPKTEHIAIGTATDPYQPAEREYGVTRACLEELAKREGLSISITTKSNQIVRDIDLLKRIAEKSSLSLNITVTTLRVRLARLLEPRAPRPDLRLAAVKELREAGLAVGVSVAPLLPGITDRDGEVEEIAAAAKKAGAQWFWSGVLFLMPSSAKQFLPFIREKFPRLAKQYEQWYTRNGYAPEEYRRRMSERVSRVKRELGFTDRPWEEIRRKTTPCAQMSLALAGSSGQAETSTLWAMG